MNAVITGAGGFLGKKLTMRIGSNPRILIEGRYAEIERLTLIDAIDFSTDGTDSAALTVEKIIGDITDKSFLEKHLKEREISILFHLAAIVSFQAEREFELGMRVNFFGTYRLLELFRSTGRCPIFVMASSTAVFGGDLPDTLHDDQRVTPQSSYGTQKAMGELLVDDYSRKGFVDGRVLRLPTVAVRPGKPNLAASTFVSSIIREPLQGREAVCPVDRETVIWLSSPRKVIDGLLHTLNISKDQLGFTRVLNLPGISITVREMIECLKRGSGIETVGKISFVVNPDIQRIVQTWPREVDTQKALSLGYSAESSFEEIISDFKNNDLTSE